MTYRYEWRGQRVTSKRRLSLGEVSAIVRERERVAKAADSVPVYDGAGRLVGTVDPARINTFAAYPTEQQEPAAAASAGSDGDLWPAPSDEAGVPASEVAKAAQLIGQNAAERRIAKAAIEKITGYSSWGDLPPAARAILRARAVAVATAEVDRHRQRR